jgi:hypothetical protein
MTNWAVTVTAAHNNTSPQRTSDAPMSTHSGLTGTPPRRR